MKSAFNTPTFSKELSGWDNPLREERPWIVPAKCEALARVEKTRPFDLPKLEITNCDFKRGPAVEFDASHACGHPEQKADGLTQIEFRRQRRNLLSEN